MLNILTTLRISFLAGNGNCSRMMKGIMAILIISFLFNDLSYFDTIQANWEPNGISLDKHNLHDLMLYVLLWRNFLAQIVLRISRRVLSLYPLPPLWNLTHDPFCLPDAKIISKVMHQLTAEDLWVILPYSGKMSSPQYHGPAYSDWDGKFTHSNSNNNKVKGTDAYSDPDAGYDRSQWGQKGHGIWLPERYTCTWGIIGYRSIFKCFPRIGMIPKRSRKR